MFRDLGTIDLTSMNLNQAYVLGLYLMDNPDQGIIIKNDLLRITVSSPNEATITYIFEVSHSILYRKRRGDKSQTRYEVISENPNDQIAPGISRLLGTLSLQLDGIVVFSNSRRRVLKDLYKSHGSIPETEIAMLSQLDHINAKEMMLKNFLVMKFLRGMTLKSLCDDPNLMTEQRFLLSIRCLRALDQLHCLNIVHRDIKPLNIICHKEKITIFDFGLSKYLHERDNRYVGTAGFSPFEQRFGQSDIHDFLSDAFAMGRTLAKLWKLQLITTGRLAINANEFENLQSDSSYTLKEFDRIVDLTPNQQSVIPVIICSMTLRLRMDRLSIVEALHKFEKLYLEQLLKNCPEEQYNNLIYGNNVGLSLLSKLRKTSIDNLDPLARIAKYREILLSGLSSVAVNDTQFQECIRVLGIKRFYGRTPQYITRKIDRVEKYVMQDFKRKKLSAILDRLAKQPITNDRAELCNDIKNTLLRQHKLRFFGEFMKAQHKMRKKYKEYKIREENIKSSQLSLN